MRSPCHRRLVAVLGATFVAFLFRPDAAGADGAPAAQPPGFKLALLSQELAPDLAVQALIATTASNRFTFIPPATWRYLAIPAESKVRLVGPSPDVMITLAFREDGSSETNELSNALVKSLIAENFPDSVVREEFPAMALGKPGKGFDVEWRSAAGARKVARVAYARFQGGTLEAVLIAPPNEITRYHHPLNALLLSLRRSPLAGKLAVQNIRPE